MKMRKRFLSLLLCLVLLAGLLPVTAFAATTIDSADIMVTHPAHMANPDYLLQIYGNCNLDTTYNSKGHKNGVRWKDLSTGEYMEESDTFVGGQKYELSVHLISKTGYAFSASASTVTANSEPTSLTVTNVSRAQAVITLTADKLYINHATITGLDAPQVGNTADFFVAVQENSCELYASGNSGMFWLDRTEEKYLGKNDQFKAGHQYAAGIYLQAKSGYEFPQNVQVTLDGKACTIGQNDGRILQAVMEYAALAEKHTHSVSDWRTTGAYHYKVCTTCGEFLEQEDHKGGVATCSQKGKCTVCGYAYIEENEKHNPDTAKWTACGSLYHAHLCKDCGAHCDAQDHVAGPAGTPDAAVVCKDCGYIITPAKNHTHKLTKVAKKAATCTAPGNVEYYTCNGCADVFADSEGKTKVTNTVIAPLGHKASDDWKKDNDNHWRICSVCNTVLAETKLAHEMVGGKCTSCGFEKTAVSTTPATQPSAAPGTLPNTLPSTAPETESDTEPSIAPEAKPETDKTEPTSESATDEEDGGNNLLWLWITLAVVIAGGGGFAFYWLVLKKKKV